MLTNLYSSHDLLLLFHLSPAFEDETYEELQKHQNYSMMKRERKNASENKKQQHSKKSKKEKKEKRQNAKEAHKGEESDDRQEKKAKKDKKRKRHHQDEVGDSREYEDDSQEKKAKKDKKMKKGDSQESDDGQEKKAKKDKKRKKGDSQESDDGQEKTAKKDKKRKRPHEDEVGDTPSDDRQEKKKAKKDKKRKKYHEVSDSVEMIAKLRGYQCENKSSIPTSPMPEDDCKLRGFVDLFEKAAAVNPKKGIFIEFYAGKGCVAARAEAKYDLIGIAIDNKDHPAWDLRVRGVVPFIRKQLRTGRVKGGHAGTECTSFSSARHGKEGDNCPKPLRDYGENAWGFPDLGEKDQEKLEAGNLDARVTLELLDAFEEYKVPMGVENGHTSILWHLPEFKEKLKKARVFRVDYCMMGRKFRKRTRLAVWGVKNQHILDQVVKECSDNYHCLSKKSMCCRTGHGHQVLRGWSRGTALSAAGKFYPRKFANIIAKLLLA